MSQQNLSVLGDDASSFLPPHRHGYGYVTTSHRGRLTQQTVNASTAKDATTLLFDGLDEARFDQVRRAVNNDRNCLLGMRHDATHSQLYSPIQYALANCERWQALAAHCIRTGLPVATVEGRSFRERLYSMNVIVAWLLQQPEISIPNGQPLHTALACGLDLAAAMFCRKAPWLASSTDLRGKTPAHVVCSLSNGMRPSEAAKIVVMLAHTGTNCAKADNQGLTPLHDLLDASTNPASSHGLIRRRQAVTGVEYVRPIIDVLLSHGARLDEHDNMWRTPVDIAFYAGLDYVTLIRRAAVLRERIVRTSFSNTCAFHQDATGLSSLNNGEASQPVDVQQFQAAGMWATLPEDVILKIMTYLTPCEIVSGLGRTCQLLRRTVAHSDLWKHLDLSFSLDLARKSVSHNSYNPAIGLAASL